MAFLASMGDKYKQLLATGDLSEPVKRPKREKPPGVKALNDKRFTEALAIYQQGYNMKESCMRAGIGINAFKYRLRGKIRSEIAQQRIDLYKETKGLVQGGLSQKVACIETGMNYNAYLYESRKERKNHASV